MILVPQTQPLWSPPKKRHITEGFCEFFFRANAKTAIKKGNNKEKKNFHIIVSHLSAKISMGSQSIWCMTIIEMSSYEKQPLPSRCRGKTCCSEVRRFKELKHTGGGGAHPSRCFSCHSLLWLLDRYIIGV